MTQLALELNDSRRNVSKALNYLETEGIVSLKRNFVEIKHIEDALQNIELRSYNQTLSIASSKELANGVIPIEGYDYVGYLRCPV